jgi:SAM-dependent methyltransferase
MPPDTGGFPRIFAPPAAGDDPPPAPAPHLLATRELLRPPARRRGDRELDPYSRAWFEEIEIKRYTRHGTWLPRVLEFSRHTGESLVMFGPGLGTDALQYLRHGTKVTLCVTPADHPDLIRRNFDFRGTAADLVHVSPGDALPFARGAFDLAYLNALHDPGDPGDPGLLARTVAELYRVLKPGGKVFALFPAKFDAGYWQDFVLPIQHWYWRRPPDPASGAKQTARGLRQTFGQFTDVRIGKRHLRRTELPHAWRLLPLSILERLLGRVLVLRAFKTLATARADITAAA